MMNSNVNADVDRDLPCNYSDAYIPGMNIATRLEAKGANPKDCKLLVARGDSMEPYLSDKNVFMVDVSSTHIMDGERYAIYFNDEPLVKQIFKQADGALVLHSYNSAYPDKLVQREQLQFVHIVGRVIYRSG
jgi:phage repressor protein C with HTH and peptisase S24 domain